MEDVYEDGSVNFTVNREYDEDGNVLVSHVEMFSDGGLTEAKYSVRYKYTFFD